MIAASRSSPRRVLSPTARRVRLSEQRMTICENAISERRPGKTGVDPPVALYSFRWCRRGPSLPVLACELAGNPEIVMLLRPVEIDLAGAHGLERTLHPERADIDVAKDQRDEQYSHDGVHYLCELHAGDVDPGEKWKQQHKAGNGNGNASR